MTKKSIKEKIVLEVQKREIFGRKVKKLRREGILPANIYGKGIKSLAVQVPLKDFQKVYEKVGETGILELKVAKEEKTRPVLIHNVQLHPVTDEPLHVDFHQVSLKEKITTSIPVEVVGESPAVEQKIGVLIRPLTEVEVEALPTELPEKFTVDISQLKEIDQAIRVGDLQPPEGVKILTAPGEILVKIGPLEKEETAPPSTEEKPAEEKPAEEERPESKPEEKAASPEEEKKE